MTVRGKVALVTGAGRGLGKAVAKAYAGRGMKVMMMSLNGGELKRTAEEIADMTGETVLHAAGDVSDRRDVSRAVAEAIGRFGPIDVLVNNAGIIGPPRFLEDADPDSWSRTLGVNLGGIYLCTRAVLPAMVKRRQGKIINIVSGLGEMPYPRFCAYAVSKAGAIQLTRSLASELQPVNIQVNAIDPGVMDTAMQNRLRKMDPEILGEDIHRNFVSYKQQGVLKDPDKVAPLAVFLASSDSDNITGEIGTLRHYRRLGWKSPEG